MHMRAVVSVAYVHSKRLLMAVRRGRLFERFSTHFEYILSAKRPIVHSINHHPLPDYQIANREIKELSSTNINLSFSAVAAPPSALD